MSILSGRHDHYLFRICILFCSVVILPPLWAEEDTADAGVTGSWIAEPALGQLGFIQVSFTFREDGLFSQKLNFVSFCGIGALVPDCEYFWTVSEGKYFLAGKIIHLRHEKARSVQLRKGQTAPQVNDMGMKPLVEEFRFRINQGKLIFTDKNGKSQTFMPMSTGSN